MCTHGLIRIRIGIGNVIETHDDRVCNDTGLPCEARSFVVEDKMLFQNIDQ
jgi:hypothetical protein